MPPLSSSIFIDPLKERNLKTVDLFLAVHSKLLSKVIQRAWNGQTNTVKLLIHSINKVTLDFTVRENVVFVKIRYSQINCWTVNLYEIISETIVIASAMMVHSKHW
ncbi:hypothetical protein BLEM_2282 [Bifidobacterium lemurum]|uniref:Uncharacterized protein n=1 Tax=Bifidobacterium lemurum TaxID=1603886 RepID=A0A261FJR8_9BIFI|nr:hypothetical protein BLEM_2282 [Bifidobacterium lemurum]